MKLDLRETMLELCKQAGFEPTENFDKIVKAKERMGIGLLCPCSHAKGNNDGRSCISEICANDIIEKGRCLCGCYQRSNK